MERELFNAPVRWGIFIAAALIFFVVLYGAGRGRRQMSNRVIDWLPEDFNETREFYWFLDHFYEGELLMASWDGCTPDDPRLDEIAQILTTSDDSGRTPYYWKVLTTASVFREMTDNPLRFTRDEAYERMRGWILSKDDMQGCLVAFLSDEGYKNPHAAIANIRNVASEVTHLPDGVRIAGPSLDSVAIDDASENSQKRLLPFFLLLCIVMLFVLLKTWLAVYVIFISAIFNEEMSAALIYFSGTNMDSISLLCGSLIFVLTISGGLHLLNYYRDNLRQTGKKGAAYEALKKASFPCGLACLTTVLGLYSLSLSQVVPIRHFGIFSSNALILGTLFFFFFIGAFVEQFPLSAWLVSDPKKSPIPNGGNSVRSKWAIENTWNWLPPLVIRHRCLLTIVNFGLLAFSAFYLPRLDSTVTFHGMFRKDAPVIQDYNYLESRIGGLIPLEVVISIPDAANEGAAPLQMLGLLDTIERRLWEIDGVETSLSALNFVPYIPDSTEEGARAVAARVAFNKMVSARLSALQEACLYDNRILPSDQTMRRTPAQRWRISLRVCAESEIAYGPFLKKIGESVNQIIAENQVRCGLRDVSSLITGGVPVAHKAQERLLKDLTRSYLSAFVMILVTLIVLLKRFTAGILAMIPNIFPSVLVFGTMALLHQPVDMGTMMTASVALGISVDGTIHFLTWFCHGLGEGKTQNEAIQFAYRKCGTAMIQATIVCGGGMLVFALSHFVPISRFAWMLALLLLIALYGDLILFPALLAGRFGRRFRSYSRHRPNEETSK